MSSYERCLSRPIRIDADDFSLGKATVLNRQTRIASIQVTPNGGDVVFNFRNGIGGEILHTVEADAGDGTKNIDFGYFPPLYTQGIIVEGDITFLNSITVNVIEPQSSGT